MSSVIKARTAADDDIVELRSDTFSLPTDEMRQAMARAPVGNDDYGEDPSVNELEELAARLTGKPAAVLLPSGTMANLTAILSWCRRGSLAIVGRESDIYLYEAHGASVCGGVGYQPIPHAADGGFEAAELAAALPEDPQDPQFARPELVCLESPHNRAGGVVVPAGRTAEVAAFAARWELAIHLDGARLFNAAVMSGRPAAALAAEADSVQFCLSKGLAAPVGSVLAGPSEFIDLARRWRKLLGGSMRQAGVIAAAGTVALTTMVDRLATDHRRAAALAAGLADIGSVTVQQPQTNVVLWRVDPARMAAAEVIEKCSAAGVRFLDFGAGRIRATTYVGIEDRDIDRAVDVVRQVVGTAAVGNPTVGTAAVGNAAGGPGIGKAAE